jgi:hypothetical protein
MSASVSTSLSTKTTTPSKFPASPGQEQRARLGHYTKNLDSSNAHYIDVTNVEHVGSDHGYFKGDAVRKNRELWKVFHDMFRGKIVEHQLQYHTDNNSYRF